MAIIEEVVDDVHAAPPVKPPVKKEKPAFVPADTFEVGARVGRQSPFHRSSAHPSSPLSL